MITINTRPIERFTFPAGESHVTASVAVKDVKVKAWLRSSDDIMDMLLTCNALKEHGCVVGCLEIPYIPYGRQDRICNYGESYSIKVMADLINSIGAPEVISLDPHSLVTGALINNFKEVKQARLTKYVQVEVDYICAPDSGAIKKAFETATLRKTPLILANKVRNLQTGEITKTEILTDVVYYDKKVLIVDDLCDGGRTFLELAKVLKREGVKRIYLYVTHGIFSKGLEVFDGLIDHIWTTDSYCQIDHPMVTVLHI